MIKKRISYSIIALLFLASIGRLEAQDKYIRLGDDAYNQFQYQAAIENYQKALTQLSGNADERDRITLRLAEIYSRTNDWKMASSYYKRLVTSGYAGKNPACYFGYAVSQQYLGQDSLALQYFDTYLAAFPADSVAFKCRKDLAEKRHINQEVEYEVTNAKVFNSSNDDFSLIYSNKKENEVIFTSNRKGATGKELDQWTSSSFSDLFKSSASKSDKFSAPVNADEQGVINTEANEGAPFLNDNFSTMYFTRCEKKPENKDGNMWCVIMKAQRSGARWAKPELMLSDPERNIGHPTLTSDELTMIYSGSNEGGSGQKDLWMVKKASIRDQFGPPVNLGPVINTAGNEMFPYLRNDSLLYFASDGHGGFGGLDIWQSLLLPSGAWSAPQNMGSPINSNTDDFSIVFRSCCEEGYFSSNRDEGRGGDDIYHFARIRFNISLSGKIKDVKTGLPLASAQVTLSGGADTLTLGSDAEGNYRFADSLLAENTDYQLTTSHKKYLTQKQMFSTKGEKEDRHFTVDFALEPIPEAPIVLPQILYELDKWDLQPQYQDSLLNFVAFLKDNPNLKIELRSHTDSRATDKYNDELSQRRAQTVVDFLISKGIEPGRMVAKGYGKRSPRKMETEFRSGDLYIPKGTVLDDAFISSLQKQEWQETAHQLNRRTEFIVISTTYKP